MSCCVFVYVDCCVLCMRVVAAVQWLDCFIFPRQNFLLSFRFSYSVVYFNYSQLSVTEQWIKSYLFPFTCQNSRVSTRWVKVHSQTPLNLQQASCFLRSFCTEWLTKFLAIFVQAFQLCFRLTKRCLLLLSVVLAYKGTHTERDRKAREATCSTNFTKRVACLDLFDSDIQSRIIPFRRLDVRAAWFVSVN